MSYDYSFPFTIEEVANLCGLQNIKVGKSSIDATCPFCDDKKRHLNINTHKHSWRCNRCGEHGGVLALYSKLFGTTNAEALKEIQAKLGIKTAEDVKYHQKKVAQKVKETNYVEPKHDLQQNNAVYKEYLSLLSLFGPHNENLLNRGLTEHQIKNFGYKSVPPCELSRKIAQEFVSDTTNIAGFFVDDKGRRTVNTCYYADKDDKIRSYNNYDCYSGFYIPIRDIDGNICAMQIRRDSSKGSRYTWFTSIDLPQGNKAYSGVHFVGVDKTNPPKAVYLTEGALKADIAHCLSNKPFIAVAGVNQTAHLKDALLCLKELGVELICVALDMDTITNPRVAEAEKKIRLIISETGLSSKRIGWDKQYKGIDDFLLYAKNKNQNNK